MEQNVLCSEDGNNPAVCACFCCFPLPTLCRDCVFKHQVDPGVFQHFHLPVYASQLISTKEMRMECSLWLLSLHNALRSNEDDLARFEEQVEAARLEAHHQLDQSVGETKQRLTKLKDAFQEEMQRAVTETSAHAMEQWSPESGSLSSWVWFYGTSNPASLKMFRLWAEVGDVKQAVRVSIETHLPSLAGFSEPPKDSSQCTDRNEDHKTLEEGIKEADGLAAENEILKIEVKQLREQNTQLTEQLERVKESSSLEIEKLKKEVESLESNLETLRLSASVNERIIREKVSVLLAEGAREKGAFRYNESAQCVQHSWDLVQSFGDKQTAAVGAVLAEVLGVHLGKVTEAREVLTKSLDIEMRLDPTSEEVLKLYNLSAVLNFFCDNDAEAAAICLNSLRTLGKMNSEELWVAVFYRTFALCSLSKIKEAESFAREWTPKTLCKETHLSQLLKLAVRGTVQSFKAMNQEAEALLLEAHQLAASHFPTSIYAALLLFRLGRVHTTMKQAVLAKEQHSAAEVIFATHFSACIWATHNLTWLSDLCRDMGQREVAVQKRLEAHRIYEAHFPTHIYTANNLTHLAVLYEDMGQLDVAVQKKLEAHRIYGAHFPTRISTASNLASLGPLYEQMNRLEEAERTYEQARSLYFAHNPTSTDAAINLYNLGLFYEKRQKIDEALTCLTSAFEVWTNHNSKNAQSLALPVLNRLKEATKKQ